MSKVVSITRRKQHKRHIEIPFQDAQTAYRFLMRAQFNNKQDVLTWLRVFLQHPHAAALPVLRKWGKANLPDRKYVELMRYVNLYIALYKVVLENPHYTQERPYYNVMRRTTINDILNIVRELNYE